jgi:hypothetical protein
MTHTVATGIASTLKSCGVDHFFMLTGGDQPLWIALRDAGVAMIVARSEPGAVQCRGGAGGCVLGAGAGVRADGGDRHQRGPRE